MSEFAAYVATGIAALDERGPADWRKRVNLDTLNQSSTKMCVLGQVFGDYNDGLDALFADRYCDFETRYSHGYSTPGYNYDALTAAWKDALADGRKAFVETRTLRGFHITPDQHFFFDGHGIIPTGGIDWTNSRDISGALHGTVKVSMLRNGNVSLRSMGRKGDGRIVHLSSGTVVVDGVTHTLADFVK